jgi:hypothetical protein
MGRSLQSASTPLSHQQAFICYTERRKIKCGKGAGEWNKLLKRQRSHDFMHLRLKFTSFVCLFVCLFCLRRLNSLSKVGPIITVTADTSLVRY